MTALGELSLNANLTDTTRYNLEQSLDANCKLAFASSAQQFHAAFHDFEAAAADDDDEKECVLLQETNQSKLYCIKARFGNGYVIGKVYKHKAKHEVIREFLIVRTLKLMPYYNLFHLHHSIVLVMKLLPHSLPQYVRCQRAHAPLHESHCKRIMAEILHKLWKLHKIGYIHCDIKPSNIMKDEHEWFLIDFGYVFHESRANDKCINCQYFGSVGWTPPELRPYTDDSTRNVYSTATDIWPIGLLILWLLLDGEQPYLLSKQEMAKFAEFQQRLECFYYGKLLRDGDQHKGQMWLASYLKSLRDEERISTELHDLLSNEILLFDATQRSDCAQIWKHKWFDSIRGLYGSEKQELEVEDEEEESKLVENDEEETQLNQADVDDASDEEVDHRNGTDWMHWFAESIDSCRHYFE